MSLKQHRDESEPPMHVPDGFLDAATSVGTGAAATAGVALALRKAREELDERAAPLAGLTAAFVFAAQMINFPVGVGTSGHLMGGALAAVLVGPWTAVLVMSVVLLVQALLFADGGLTALGTNVTLIGLVTVAVGWFAARSLLAVLPRRPASVVPAATAGALLSVPAAALVFVLLYSIGGAASLPLGTLTATMVGWHTLIGVGEAIITGLTVSAVVAVRPDLVFAARDLRPALKLRRPDGSYVDVPEPASESASESGSESGSESTSGATPRRGRRPILVGGSAAALLLAGVASFFASGRPDGLEYVAEDQGFLATAREHAFSGFALAEYGDVAGIPVGIAGVLGVLATVAAGLVLFRVLRRRAARREDVTT